MALACEAELPSSAPTGATGGAAVLRCLVGRYHLRPDGSLVTLRQGGGDKGVARHEPRKGWGWCVAPSLSYHSADIFDPKAAPMIPGSANQLLMRTPVAPAVDGLGRSFGVA